MPTPLNRVAMRAYTVQPALQAGPGDLALQATHLRGVLRVEQLMLPHQRRIESATSGGCWPLMWLMWCWSTRVASAPAQRVAGLPELRRLEHRLRRAPVHHVLCSTQSRLASRLNNALAASQASGALEAVRQSALVGLMRRQVQG